jgi:hypothetical protein
MIRTGTRIVKFWRHLWPQTVMPCAADKFIDNPLKRVLQTTASTPFSGFFGKAHHPNILERAV